MLHIQLRIVLLKLSKKKHFIDSMTNPNALWEDMEKLNALYEELCWDHDDELVFTHDGEDVIIYNKTKEQKQ